MTVSPVQLGSRPGALRKSPVRPVKIAMVCMPFAAIERPSIQIGLLSAIANDAGHDATPLHLNVEFARELEIHSGEIAVEQYRQLSGRRYATADWFFSHETFGEHAPDPDLLLGRIDDADLPEGTTATALAAFLMKIRDHVVPQYLDRMMAEVDWRQFDVVGFTSTFQQNCPAFAMARRIKQAHPDITMLFGGSNFDAEMGREWVRGVEVIDYVIQGEADTSFVSFLDAIANKQDPIGIPGVIAKRDDAVVGAEAEVASDLRNAPIPEYDDFFERMKRYDLIPHLDLAIPFESARGCWWGAKRHCTFCGLNGQTMDFRSKPAQQVVDEVTALALKHRVLSFEAVDNIMEMEYFDHLLPELANRNRPFSLFYEVKADLSREQIKLMVASGIDSIQPGIESIHSRVLGLMRKGTRSIWNVNVLRWCRYYGVSVAWNVLWGFPGEQLDHVIEQAETLPLMHHVEPHGGGSRIWLERFSPLFVDREAFPARSVTPHSDYAQTYPTTLDYDKIAYFFDYELEGTLPDEAYAPLTAAIDEWLRLVDEGVELYLLVRDEGDRLVIRDHRTDADEIVHEVCGLPADIHRAIMDSWSTPAQLADTLAVEQPLIERALDELVQLGLVFRDGKLHLALALPEEPPELRGRVCEKPNFWAR